MGKRTNSPACGSNSADQLTKRAHVRRDGENVALKVLARDTLGRRLGHGGLQESQLPAGFLGHSATNR